MRIRDGEILLLGLYVVGLIIFLVLYRRHELYNSGVMACFWPLTAPFILAFLLFFSVKGSAKKIMKKIITETTKSNAAKEIGTPMPIKKSKQRVKNKEDFEDMILLEEADLEKSEKKEGGK